MPVIAGAAALLGSLAGTFVGTIAVNMAISIGIGYIAQKIGEFGRDDAADDFGPSIKTNRISNTAAIPIVYGTRVVGGTEHRSTSGLNNRYLWRIMVLSEGEIDAVTNVYLNDKDIETYTDDRGNLVYGDLVEYWVHTGTEGQAADTNLVTSVDDWSGDHRGKGVAYLVVKMEYDRNVFSGGMPTLTARVRGRKVYDPRNPEADDAWSDNPALCIRDYLTNTRYGRGIDSTLLDDDTFTEAANYCDQTVTVKDESNTDLVQARYTCNGVVNPDQTSLDIIQRLCTACRAVIIPPGEKYKLIIDRPETSVYTFDEDNITGAWNIAGASTRTHLNRCNTRFYDAANNFEEALAVTDSTTYRTEDNERVLEAEISLPFTDQRQRADIMAQHHIKQSRQGWRVFFTATLEALNVLPMDVVSITHSTPGWDAKLFRIHALDIKENDTVEVTAQEYDPSIYTFDLHTPPEIPDTDLPDPFDTPPPVNLVLASGTDELLIAADGTIITRIAASWDAPENPFVHYYEIGWKLSASTGWTQAQTGERTHHIAPVADGMLYDVRVRAIYSSGRRSDWLVKTAYMVVGKSAPPASPSNFSMSTQRDYTRLFEWTLNTIDKDVAGYQIRYSANLTDANEWDDADAWDDLGVFSDSADVPIEWKDMTPLHEGLLVSSPWETTLLSAGTYRFAIKTIDTTGNESLKAVFITSELYDPPLVSVFKAEYPHLMSWPGTLTDCYVSNNLLVATDTKDWSDFTTDGTTWSTWTGGWLRSGNNLVYEHTTIDLGVVKIFRPVIRSEAEGTATYLINYSDDDVTYSGWVAPADDISARYIKVKITVTGTVARLKSVSILLDGQQYTDEVGDLATSSLSGDSSRYIAAGNIRIPTTTTTFHTITSVQVALGSDAAAGWSWQLIDKQPTYGPQIKIYDHTNTLADCTIDAIIKGY